jgi:hypothetical protein
LTGNGLRRSLSTRLALGRIQLVVELALVAKLAL